MRYLLAVLCVACLFASLYLNTRAAATLLRANSLVKRAQVLEQEIGKLDRRIKKQEGIKHGFGF